MAKGNPEDPTDDKAANTPDGAAPTPATPGGSRPVDDALSVFASTLAALSEPTSETTYGTRRPRPSASPQPGASTPSTGRSIDDLLSGFQSTLASLPGQSDPDADKPVSKPVSPRTTARKTPTTAKAAGSAASSSDSTTASVPSWRDRLAAASAAAETPAPTPAPELPEFLRSRETPSRTGKTPTPAPAEPANATPSWRDRLTAASTAAAAPLPAAEMPEFLRPRGKAAAAAPSATSATERLAKLLADTQSFEAPAAVEVEPEPVSQPEPVAQPVKKPRKSGKSAKSLPVEIAPVGDLTSDLPMAAELTVEPVEPVVAAPVKPPVEAPVEPPAEPLPVESEVAAAAPRRTNIRRPSNTPIIRLSEPSTGAALPSFLEPEVSEPAVVEPEAVAPVAEEPIAEPEAAVEAAPVVAPVSRWRGRKGRAAAVALPEPAAEPESESAVPAIAVTTVAADEKADGYAVTPPEDGSWWDEKPDEGEGEEADQAAAATKTKRKWTRSSILLLVLALALVVGALVTGGSYLYKQIHHPVFLDLNGNKVLPDDTSVYDPAYVTAADAQPDVGERFKVPSVNLDVPLGSVNQVDNLINPPGYTSVYWVKNMGVSLANAENGTVYVVTHSVRAPGMAPGDFLIDQKTTTVVVPAGAEIDVADRVYKVVSSMTVSKDQLGAQTSLWAGTPGMLVLITCMQGGEYLSNGHSATNVVIIGSLVS